MKTSINILTLTLSVVIATLGACKKEELKPLSGMKPNPATEELRPKPTTTIYSLDDTKWKITHWEFPHSLVKNPYADNTFIFYQGGNAEVLKSNDVVVKGTWSYINGNKQSLSLDYGKNNYYSQLNGNWRVVSRSETIMFLEADKNGNTAKVTMETL